MSTESLLITVDFDRAMKMGDSVHVDLRKLVATVPTARIVSGDPAISVRVNVDKRERGKLLATVSPYCIVDDYADLDFY
jgi:hypothetical protein